MVEGNWMWTVVAILRSNPKPVGASIKNDIKWLLVGANIHLREQLHIMPVLQVLCNQFGVVGDQRCGTGKMLLVSATFNLLPQFLNAPVAVLNHLVFQHLFPDV